MNIKLRITNPSNDIGFIEYKRSFCVEGEVLSDCLIPNNAKLVINLFDSNNSIVRSVCSNFKNEPIYAYYPDLIAYKESDDENRIKMQEFGFPLLRIDDIENPSFTINKASIKCWYNDRIFKAIFVSASSKESGALFESDLNLVDDNNNEYGLLPIGNYTIEVTLSSNGKLLSTIKKDIVIGRRNKQLIGRFNPISHKNNLIKWCNDNDVSIITDMLPGYLDSYMGNWEYHKGLLKTYRANDLCLFEDVDVFLFNYLIDSTSTSYETELGYLQANNKINRVSTYYYDIGEFEIDGIKAKILKFNNDEYGRICRIDILKNISEDNIYYLDRRNVDRSIVDLSNVEIENSIIAIMGIIKPIQLNSEHFVLNDDNTYEMLDYPSIIKYTFICGNNEVLTERKANMERIDVNSIGNSVYEFYNVFDINDYVDKEYIIIKVECVHKKGKTVPIDTVKINIKR